MPAYDVRVHATCELLVSVTADNEDEAIELAHEKVRQGDYQEIEVVGPSDGLIGIYEYPGS